MKTLRKWLAVGAAATSLHANAGQYTDLWYNPQESGWGANIVQQLETAFVTLFVYGPDGKPTWYVASDARVIAYSSGALPIFSGTLYRMQGPWHGGPFDPRTVNATAVGSVSLEALSKDRMRIHYEAEGVKQVKEVVRQTWQEPLVAANYQGIFNLRQAVPQGQPFGTLQFNADVLLHFSEGVAFMRADDEFGRRCEYRGPYEQTGKLAKISGDYTCTASGSVNGSSGTFAVSDLEVTDNGFSGYLRTFSTAVTQYGRFGGVQW
jgi:hypothetical protein